MNKREPEKCDSVDEFNADETARRRDEVVRRMANTLPQPRQKPICHQEKKKPSVSDRADHKNANPNGKT